MINALAEGRAYHELKDLAMRFGDMQYQFCKNRNLHTLIASYRYYQPKLFNKDQRLSLYPSQLTVLARYYFYHYKKEHMGAEDDQSIMTEEEVRNLLCEWIMALQRNLQENREEYVPWTTFEHFSAPWFQMPLHSNAVPLDVILQDAMRMGPLDQDGLTDYPDPTGLPIRKESGETEAYSGSEDRNEFWKTQLAALTKIWYDSRKKEADKKRKPGSENETDFEKPFEALTDAEIEGYAMNRQIQAMLMLAVWYAQQFQLQKQKMTDLGMDPGEDAVWVVAEIQRICGAHMEFNSDFDECLLLYSKMVRKLPLTFGKDANTVLQFVYAEPEEKEYDVQLPAWEVLDNGYRNWDYNDYYGIHSSLPEKILGMPHFKANEFGSKDDARYTFREDIPTEETIKEKLCAFYAKLAPTLIDAQKEIPADKVKTMRETMCSGSLPQEQREKLADFWDDMFGKKASKPVKNNINAIRIQDMTGKKGDKLQESVRYLLEKNMLDHYKRRIPKTEQNDELKLLKKSFYCGMYDEFLTADQPAEALAEVVARTYTWVVLLLEDWKQSGSQKNTYILWQRAKHLRISAERLKEEHRFYEELLKLKDAGDTCRAT